MTRSLRYTSADLELLPDIDGVRYEIIDGDLFVAKQPHARHQRASVRISSALDNWNDLNDLGVVLVAPGLIFNPEDDVAPDVVWVSRDRLSQVMDDAGHLRAAPELVVEVVSPGAVNERRDRDLKLKLYSRQGVSEYWIVDWRLKNVQVYLRTDAELRLHQTLSAVDSLTSPLLPGFSCPVARLFDL